MQQKEVMPTDMKVLMNHIYEYKKVCAAWCFSPLTSDLSLLP